MKLTCNWALVDPDDVEIIESIILNRTQMIDQDGWHFTKNGKYTIKFDYQVERVCPATRRTLPVYVPTITSSKGILLENMLSTQD